MNPASKITQLVRVERVRREHLRDMHVCRRGLRRAGVRKLQELDEAVQTNGGVLRVSMWSLRELAGYTRLKVRVVASIHEELANRRIDHLPADLPGDQYQMVALFKVGSEAGAVVAAIRKGVSTEQAESALRRPNTSDSLKAEREQGAKLAELADQLEELEAIASRFREILK